MMASIDSVRPTVATASEPSLDTQKMSTTANSDSIDISSTIGTARRITARPTGTCVKSSCDPRMASRMVAQKPDGTDELGDDVDEWFTDRRRSRTVPCVAVRDSVASVCDHEPMAKNLDLGPLAFRPMQL